MAGEVICPTCGTASPTSTKVCSQCGTSLDLDGGATSRSRALSGTTKRPPLRKATGGSLASVKTLSEEDDEGPEARPTVKAAPVKGPVPKPAPAARRNPPRATGEKELSSASGVSGGVRDKLLGVSLQEYVIEQKLGTGGMGVVYKATHKLIGKSVAIKVLRADIVQDPRDMDRLLDEARIISAIKHRGIINIFGAGTTDDGRHYLIMELLEGESLEQLMQREGKVPAGDAVVILEQVLSALSAAHEAGVVHRDLKPANVFLVKEGNLFYVKLLDFGLARRSQQNVTRIAGTPDYISPEHARGRPAGPPADLYAFGVLCFHMLTGQLPFIGTTPMEVMEKHVHSAPPVPHEVNKEIPKALSELILKLLAKDPGERPDAAHVKADLRAATKQMRNASTMMSMMAVEAVSDKPPPPEDKKRAQKLALEAQVADVKRKAVRRWPLIAGGIGVVWLLGVGAYVLWPSAPPEPPPTPPVKKPLKTDPPPVAKVDLPKTDTPPATDPGPKVDPTPVAKVDNPEVTPTTDPTNVTPIGDEPDAATEDPGTPQEDPNTEIDDVRLGELKRGKRIDERLDEIDSSMKQNRELREMLQIGVKRAREKCDKARTLGDFYDCDDEVTKQYNRYLKNI